MKKAIFAAALLTAGLITITFLTGNCLVEYRGTLDLQTEVRYEVARQVFEAAQASAHPERQFDGGAVIAFR